MKSIITMFALAIIMLYAPIAKGEVCGLGDLTDKRKWERGYISKISPKVAFNYGMGTRTGHYVPLEIELENGERHDARIYVNELTTLDEFAARAHSERTLVYVYVEDIAAHIFGLQTKFGELIPNKGHYRPVAGPPCTVLDIQPAESDIIYGNVAFAWWQGGSGFTDPNGYAYWGVGVSKDPKEAGRKAIEACNEHAAKTMPHCRGKTEIYTAGAGIGKNCCDDWITGFSFNSNVAQKWSEPCVAIREKFFADGGAFLAVGQGATKELAQKRAVEYNPHVEMRTASFEDGRPANFCLDDPNYVNQGEWVEQGAGKG